MSENRYLLPGWMAVITAVLAIPGMGLVLVFQRLTGSLPFMASFTGLVHLAFLAVSVYILLMFKNLLNERYDFHKTDILILVMIIFNLLSGVIGIMGLFAGLERILPVVLIAMFLPYGIISIIFAIRLLEMGEGLYGFLKPYAYLKMTEGICAVMSFLVPVVFMIVGLVVGVTAVFLLGMIFLKTKEELEYV